MPGVMEVFGDFVRVGIADVGDTYMRILTQDSPIGPPSHAPGTMVITHDGEPDASLTSKQLQKVAEREMEREAYGPDLPEF